MYKQKSVYSYKQKKKIPLIRIILVIGALVVLYMIAQNMVFLAPYLSDDHKRFKEINRQLNLPITNLPVAEQKNQYQIIINNLQKIVDKDPTKEKDWLLLGKTYLFKMKIENNPELRAMLIDRSIQSIRKGLAIHSSDQPAEFYYYLGEAYQAKGNSYYFEALKAYQAAKKGRYAGDPDLEKKMAFLYLSKGQYTIAGKLYTNLLKREKSPEIFCYSGVVNYYLKRTEQAEQNLNYCVDCYKDDPEGKLNPRFLVTAFIYMGRIYFDKNMFDIAENHFRKAQSIDPDNLDTLNMILNLYLEIGNKTQAKIIEGRIKEIEKKRLTEEKTGEKLKIKK